MGQCLRRLVVGERDGELLLVTESNPYRWFWSIQGVDDSNTYWAPFPVDVSDQIENAYHSRETQFTRDEIVIKFDRLLSKHQRIINDRQVTVMREKPINVQNLIRINTSRIDVEQPVTIQPFTNSQIDQLEMFYFSQIFDHFDVDKSSAFLRGLTTYFTLLDKTLINVLQSDFINYLKQTHFLEEGGSFDFVKLKIILEKDLQKQTIGHRGCYVERYVECLTEKTFHRNIVLMYTEEGSLYRNLNRALRYMTLKDNTEFIFYFLCLLYAFGNRNQKIANDILVYRGTSLQEDTYNEYREKTYIVGNVIINYDFTSTSKSKEKAMKFMEMGKNPKKVLFVIRIEQEDTENNFLAFKPFDLESISQFNEQEILLPPNGIFEVVSFEEENFYTKIQLDYKTNLFCDSLPFIENETEMKKKFGIIDISVPGCDSMSSEFAIAVKLKKEKMSLLRNMIHLQQLDMRDSNLGNEGMELLASLIQGMPYIKMLVLSNNQIGVKGISAFAAQLINIPNQLENINLSLNDIKDEGVKALSKQFCRLSRLQILDLSYNRITGDGMKALSEEIQNLKNLQCFDISNNKIASHGLQAFSDTLISFPNLHKLNLEACSITFAGICAFSEQMSALHNIQELNFNSNAIWDEGITHFAANMKALSNLQVLNVNRNGISDGGMKQFAYHLKDLPSLRSFDFSKNSIGTLGVKALAEQTDHFKNIRQFNLKGNCKIDSLAVKQLLTSLKSHNTAKSRWVNMQCLFYCIGKGNVSVKKELFCQQFVKKEKEYPGDRIVIKDLLSNAGFLENMIYYKNVNVIEIKDNNLGVEGMQMLSLQLNLLLHLRELLLPNNQIRNEGMIALAGQMKHLPFLEKLNLALNEIGDIGIEAFANNLEFVPDLVELDISYNEIGLAGIMNFANFANYLKKLLILKIRGNRIGDEGLAVFSQQFQFNKMTTLIELHAGFNQVTESGMIFFAQQLPYLTNLQLLDITYNDPVKTSTGTRGNPPTPNFQENKLEQDHIANQVNFNVGLDSAKNMCSVQNRPVPNFQMSVGAKNPMFSCQAPVRNQNLVSFQSTKNDEGICNFSEKLKDLTNLKELNLKVYQIGTLGLNSFFSQLHGLINLKVFRFSDNKIKDEGMQILSENLHNLPNLENLNLEGNEIGDKGMEFLSEKLEFLVNLRVLVMSSNKIGDDGMKSFAGQLHHLINICYLYFDSNLIGDEGAKAFAATVNMLPKLEELCLDSNRITELGKSALKEKVVLLPNLKAKDQF